MTARIIDLTVPIYDRMPTFPFDPKTTVTKHLGIDDLHYNIHRLIVSSHLGTHLDAPYHFYDDGLTVDQLDVTKCIGPAAVVDLRHKRARDEILPEDLERYEGSICRCRRVILRTDWDTRFPDASYFKDQPVVTEAACEWLVEREVLCLAMDLPTTHPARYLETHLLLLRPGTEVVVVEGLCGLGRLIQESVLLVVLPLPIRGCDGSPCRVIAIEGNVADLLNTRNAVEFLAVDMRQPDPFGLANTF